MANRKMSDPEIDKLFEKLDRKTASKIDSQGVPKKKTPTTNKKKTVKKSKK